MIKEYTLKSIDYDVFKVPKLKENHSVIHWNLHIFLRILEFF